MELKSSTVHRRLDSKLKIVGLEAHDLLFVLLFAAIMNLVFGQTKSGVVMVFFVPMLMATILFFTKRNKPEHYLIHLMKFLIMSGGFSASDDGGFELQRRSKIYE